MPTHGDQPSPTQRRAGPGSQHILAVIPGVPCFQAAACSPWGSSRQRGWAHAPRAALESKGRQADENGARTRAGGHDARQLETCPGSTHNAGTGANAVGSCARLGMQPARLAGGAQPAQARLGQAWSAAAPGSAKAEWGGWGVGRLQGVGGSGRNVSPRHTGSRVGMHLPAALHRTRPPPCIPKPAPCSPQSDPQTLHPRT